MKGISIRLDPGKLSETISRVRSCQEMGFESFDLKVSGNESLDGVVSTLNQSGARVRSIHLHDSEATLHSPGTPAYSRLSSVNEGVRQASLARVFASCGSLKSSHLKTLVIDAGEIAFEGSESLHLDMAAALDEGEVESVAFQDRVQAARNSYAHEHLEAFCRSLFEIQRKLEGVAISLLTPASPLGVLQPDELEHALNDMPDQARHYWHSTCASRWLHRLGGPEEEIWLERFAPRMAGVYLSDALGGDGDQAPGLGEVDFKRIKSYLGKGTARVMAIGDAGNCNALRFGTDHLTKVGIF